MTSTRSDIASAVTAAIGTMKGPLHGGAPSEVVDQLSQIEHATSAEAWVRDAIDRGERLMGFGHRVYRAYDPRAAALRTVAEGMENRPDWLELAIEVEDVVLRVLAEKHPERPLKTNVEYYAAPVLMGVGLAPDLFPADVLAGAPCRLDGPRPRAGGGQPADPTGRPLHRARGARPARPRAPLSGGRSSRATGRFDVATTRSAIRSTTNFASRPAPTTSIDEKAYWNGMPRKYRPGTVGLTPRTSTGQPSSPTIGAATNA